jgi:hypothetical protein
VETRSLQPTRDQPCLFNLRGPAENCDGGGGGGRGGNDSGGGGSKQYQ